MNDSLSAAAPPVILESAGALLSEYDLLLCDVWGVVHNGYHAYTKACAALETFRLNGGTVILVSNAPVPKERVAAMLDARRVQRSAWDDIVSSGDLAISKVQNAGYQSVYGIGPQDRDQALFKALPSKLTSLADAEAVVCTGLNNDTTEKPADYQSVLDQSLAHKLTFICANPDLVVDVGGQLYYCAGAIADLYEKMGGKVCWCGKPYPLAYETALAIAERLREQPIDKSRILAIGDSLRTDIAGARNFGIDALFVGSGIHRDETHIDGALSEGGIAKLFTADSPPAIAAVSELSW